MKSQIKKIPHRVSIKAHLMAGNGITQLYALKKFGCMRLAPRIEELRKKYPLIKTEMVSYNGKRYARYVLKTN